MRISGHSRKAPPGCRRRLTPGEGLVGIETQARGAARPAFPRDDYEDCLVGTFSYGVDGCALERVRGELSLVREPQEYEGGDVFLRSRVTGAVRTDYDVGRVEPELVDNARDVSDFGAIRLSASVEKDDLLDRYLHVCHLATDVFRGFLLRRSRDWSPESARLPVAVLGDPRLHSLGVRGHAESLLGSGKQINRTVPSGGASDALSVAFSPDGRSIVTACTEVQIWDAKASGGPRATWTAPKADNVSSYIDVRYSHSGQYILAVALNGVPYLLSATSGKLLATLSSDSLAVTSTRFLAKDAGIACCGISIADNKPHAWLARFA